MTDDLYAEADVTPADWLERLWRWNSEVGTRVGAIVPEGFDAYARIFHPAGAERWAEVAASTGATFHPAVQWHAISRGRPREDPSKGHVARTILDALIEILSPADCWFCLWEGWGSYRRVRITKVELPARSYYLIRGPVEQALAFEPETPSIWWPDDRSWCVATEIDFDTTLVGGSRARIDAILAHPDLEALEINLDARLDRQGDTIN